MARVLNALLIQKLRILILSVMLIIVDHMRYWLLTELAENVLYNILWILINGIALLQSRQSKSSHYLSPRPFLFQRSTPNHSSLCLILFLQKSYLLLACIASITR